MTKENSLFDKSLLNFTHQLQQTKYLKRNHNKHKNTVYIAATNLAQVQTIQSRIL